MLPVLLRPEADSMLMIGLGGGLSLEAVPSTIEAIYLIELEREVLRAHEVLATLRDSSPLSDPRVQVVVNDARGALALTDARFDTVVSQPSHPWTAGASHLYTREFFSIVAEHLEPGGVFVQWIGLSFVDEALLRSLVATLLEVFPHVCLFRPAPGAVLFAASDEPLDPAATAARALEAAPRDFARYGLRLAEDAASRWMLDVQSARRFAEGAHINTDDRNQLGARSAGLGKNAIRARGLTQLVSRHDPLLATTTNLNQLYLVRRLVATAQSARALRLATSLQDPVERLTALGWAKSERSQRQAVEHFRGAIRRDPSAQSARFGLLRARKSAVEKNDPKYREFAIPLKGVAAAVVAGWHKAAESDWSSIRTLEPVLATADLLDPSYTDAQRLRSGWRAASDDPESRAEAVEIVTKILQTSSQLEDVVLGAKTFAAAGRDGEALQLLDFLSRLPRDHAAYRAGLAILGSLPPDVDGATRLAIRERLSVVRKSAKTVSATDDDESETSTAAQ
jgi:hypothetical protein